MNYLVSGWTQNSVPRLTTFGLFVLTVSIEEVRDCKINGFGEVILECLFINVLITSDKVMSFLNLGEWSDESSRIWIWVLQMQGLACLYCVWTYVTEILEGTLTTAESATTPKTHNFLESAKRYLKRDLGMVVNFMLYTEYCITLYFTVTWDT